MYVHIFYYFSIYWFDKSLACAVYAVIKYLIGRYMNLCDIYYLRQKR